MYYSLSIKVNQPPGHFSQVSVTRLHTLSVSHEENYKYNVATSTDSSLMLCLVYSPGPEPLRLL